MKKENIDKIDNLMTEIYSAININLLSDLEFSQLLNIRENAYEIIKIFESEWIKTTYNNLTNMNYHTLVKILNYNWFFDNSLSKNLRDELKTFPIR